jgi:Predicted membrane protein
MAFCGNCGTQLQGDEKFCVNCGKSLSAPAATTVQGVTGIPGQLPPGAIPIAIAVPQPATKRGGKIWLILLVLAIAGIGYYYVTHDHGPANTGDSTALVSQQDFSAHWETVGGYIQISNARWTNHSGVTIQSATLQCDQYDSTGSDINQTRTILNGPLQPGTTDTFSPFRMGEVATNLDQVKCTITHVQRPSSAGQ